MPTCAAYGCRSRSSMSCGILQFFGFPENDEERLKKWTRAMGMRHYLPTKWSILCSLHFTEDDYQLRPEANRRLLKSTAVPSIFPGMPSYHQNKVVKQQTTQSQLRTTEIIDVEEIIKQQREARKGPPSLVIHISVANEPEVQMTALEESPETQISVKQEPKTQISVKQEPETQMSIEEESEKQICVKQERECQCEDESDNRVYNVKQELEDPVCVKEALDQLISSEEELDDDRDEAGLNDKAVQTDETSESIEQLLHYYRRRIETLQQQLRRQRRESRRQERNTADTPNHLNL